jgi:hypothetical protein
MFLEFSVLNHLPSYNFVDGEGDQTKEIEAEPTAPNVRDSEFTVTDFDPERLWWAASARGRLGTAALGVRPAQGQRYFRS